MKYVLRITGLPFFAGLSLIGCILLWLKHNYNFILYGGESIAYTNKNQRKTIKDIYDKLERDSKVVGCKCNKQQSTKEVLDDLIHKEDWKMVE